MSRGCLAAVVPLPLCGHCRHLWSAHWSADGCQAPTGPASVCGCAETPPDDPDSPDHTEPDENTPHEGEEKQAA